MIELKGIYKSYVTTYEVLPVLKGINLHVAKGELVSVMGESGSGKTTLLNVLGLLDNFDDGDYLLDGKSVRGLSEDQLALYRNSKIGFVFQSANLIPHLDIFDNIILPLTYRKMSDNQARIEGEILLERFGLTAWRKHYPNELSGGQKQRVAIARAIITRPEIILADEPTGQLDSATTESVMNLLIQINRDMGSTLVIVTHEQSVADKTNRIIHIKDGVIC